VRGGFAGEGNISGDPVFVDVNNPKGNDGMWGSFDDGLMLRLGSPCIDIGTDTDITEDILYNERPIGKGVELGAYEFIVSLIDKNSNIGRYSNGEFVPNNGINLLVGTLTEYDMRVLSFSSVSRVGHVKIPRNKHTRNKSRVTAYVRPIDANGNFISGAGEVAVTLIKYKEANGEMYFMTRTREENGKTFLFTEDKSLHGYNNNWAYVIYMVSGGGLHYRLPHNQFR
jgi:hypothetical protein